jgi:PsbP-like protein
MVSSSSGLRNVRVSTGMIIVLVAAVIILLIFPSNSNANNNNDTTTLLQSKSVFAQLEEQGAGTTNATTIRNNTITNNTTTESQAFLTYENPTYGIFMQYPSDWTASTSALRDYTEFIAFYSPLQNLSQPFAARLAISAVQFVQNVSLPEYTEFVLAGLQNQTGLEVKNSSEVTVAGYPGYRVVIAEQPFQNGSSLIYSMNIWTTVGNKVYLLRYDGEQSVFNQHLPEVDQILESLIISRNT